MLSRVVGNFNGIQLEATVALPYVIDPGDVGAHFVDHLHKLWKVNKSSALIFLNLSNLTYIITEVSLLQD